MPKITRAQVQKIAGLARLGISDEKAAQTARDLTNILAHFSQLQDISTAQVTTAPHPSGRHNIARPDIAAAAVLASADDLLDLSPRRQNRLIKTPSPRV